jgi:hypothetical protein
MGPGRGRSPKFVARGNAGSKDGHEEPSGRNRRQNGAKRSSCEQHSGEMRSRLLIVFLWCYVWRDLLRWVCDLSVNQEVAGSSPARGANYYKHFHPFHQARPPLEAAVRSVAR